jgi:hypothetical protein
MLRDYSKSLFFVTALLAAYTAIVLMNKKPSDPAMRSTAAIKTSIDQPIENLKSPAAPPETKETATR